MAQHKRYKYNNSVTEADPELWGFWIFLLLRVVSNPNKTILPNYGTFQKIIRPSRSYYIQYTSFGLIQLRRTRIGYLMKKDGYTSRPASFAVHFRPGEGWKKGTFGGDKFPKKSVLIWGPVAKKSNGACELSIRRRLAWDFHLYTKRSLLECAEVVEKALHQFGNLFHGKKYSNFRIPGIATFYRRHGHIYAKLHPNWSGRHRTLVIPKELKRSW